MGNLTLAGATSGQVTITPPAVAGTNTLSLPAATTTLVGQTTTDTLTNKTLTSPAISSPTISGTPVMSASVITSGTAQNSTSGTSIDFTSIPSWVKRITVMFNGVSTNGTSVMQVQLGSGSPTTTGYVSSASSCINGVVALVTNPTTGFAVMADGSAAYIRYGQLVLTLISSNTWVSSGNGAETSNARIWTCGGAITLSGTLDRVRITTVNGTDTFDAGTINILYE